MSRRRGTWKETGAARTDVAAGELTDSGGLSPKTGAVPGSLQLEWRRCGKPTCRCAGGSPHGPYAYRYWYEAGRRQKCYVPAARVAEVRVAVSRWRDLHPRLWSERRALAELRRLAEEVEAWT